MIKSLFKSKLYKAVLFSLFILLIGIVGYMWLFEYSFIDALYMTIITITTIGFGEVHPFGTGEKIFTIGLIVSSLFTFGYAVSLFSEYLISGQFFDQLKTKKVQKKIEKLKGHTIVCGYGRNGKQAISKLHSYNQKLVVVEKYDDIIKELDEHEILNIQGDATTDEALLKAGILNADYLITVLPSDADNLFVVLTASQLNKKCKIISRASEESSCSKLKIAGADNVIMPDKLGGAHMASLVVTPDVIEFVDRLTIEGDTTANLEEIQIDNLPTEYLNRTILDLDIRKKTGCTVIGYRRKNKEYIINPEASLSLKAGGSLIVLGRPEQIIKLRELF
ncbi:potassium channel protein [Tenacibaculum finnmarkense genomovar finnmarkense]|uniref:potassium channel family protein n=1 Tax=Tenacibaculum finnmarkense TaxID=2781243 RepID=UPI00187B9AF3|nr:potassium channel protein [Tenacibaculum finnmarkense]MBE7659302.1 potassium channel protein [Tenacibaculum finnmarkense genomovar finnmarkense]MCD8418024.1 potassium channel protein [Tenacibaculum finnmarkense genomovar finnmarkense]MCG8186411.1 potassium channel protein [Tenacibaculum finnmarkense genomovar finnmarkense]MCG8202858.1 potassium channel protein [Tenacibaculum finnmarkense genomovar finnmarkense]MCG8210212.1 potassium channel protein [Tenacibaculum finnmarkense genomovar finn